MIFNKILPSFLKPFQNFVVVSINPVFEKCVRGFYASKSRPSVLVAEEFFDYVIAALFKRLEPLAVCGSLLGYRVGAMVLLHSFISRTIAGYAFSVSSILS